MLFAMLMYRNKERTFFSRGWGKILTNNKQFGVGVHFSSLALLGRRGGRRQRTWGVALGPAGGHRVRTKTTASTHQSVDS